MPSEITPRSVRKVKHSQPATLRKRAKIIEVERVKASDIHTKLVIKAIPPVRELLRRPPVMKMTTREFEKISVEIQKDEGIYG